MCCGLAGPVDERSVDPVRGTGQLHQRPKQALGELLGHYRAHPEEALVGIKKVQNPLELNVIAEEEYSSAALKTINK